MRLRPDKKFSRKQEADRRNVEWRKLSPEQQIESLNSRRGNSKRQKEKISGQIPIKSHE